MKVKVCLRAMSTKPPGGCPSDVQGVGPGSAFQGLTGRGRAEAGGGGHPELQTTQLLGRGSGGKLTARAAGMGGGRFITIAPVGVDKMTCPACPVCPTSPACQPTTPPLDAQMGG